MLKTTVGALPGADTHTLIRLLSSRAVLRLKSWLPEVVRGVKVVRLGGEELPMRVGTTRSGVLRFLCLGPADWLLTGGENPAAMLQALLQVDQNVQGLAIWDLSSGLSALQLQGAEARDLLEKGCGLDMHPTVFPLGSCARTRFAQVSVVIDFIQSPDRYELYVPRSYSHYFREWLLDATRDYKSVD